MTAPIWTELWIGAGPRNPHPNFRSGLVGSAGSVKATSGTRLLRPTAAYFPVFALAALTTAHRFFVAVMIAFLPAALIFLRFRFDGSDVALGAAVPPESMTKLCDLSVQFCLLRLEAFDGGSDDFRS